MSTPANDLKDILENKGVAVFRENMYVSKEPAKPNSVITLYDTGGFAPNPKFSQGQPTVMIRVRDANYMSGYNKCVEIKDALLGLPKQVVNSTTYVGIWMESDISFIEYDDNGRAIWTMNFRISREPTPSGNRN